MRVMVTGGSGFLGTHLVAALQGSDHDIRVLDAGHGPAGTRAGVEYVRGDVRDTELLADMLAGCDVLVHLAANAMIRGRTEHFQEDAVRGAEEMVSVVEALRRTSCPRVVFASSMTVYGDRADVCREIDGLRPISTYAATKVFGESLLSVHSQTGCSAAVFRLAIVLGAGLGRGVVHDFVRRLLTDPGRLTMLGSGAQEKAYVDVSDVVRAMLGIGLTAEGFGVYNLAALPTLSVRSIAEIVADEMGLHPEIVGGGTERGWQGDVRRAIPDIGAVGRAGFPPLVHPETSVRLMVRSMVDAAAGSRS